ncbi:ribosomal-protein-alanine acetyltransferase [Paenibacillus sp. J31TS4]|uniref:ribosomal protein S18-alanine N-acetyltransferase n=1 Tax=Paenibacillus sp. J31TS4 TaxID=2807195 RepID=UPI001B152DC6|nr:ribosomal protein S18-alanine N-acetyltransferase [Paenibacillus sp. J31TS4]GIP39985.1 ribosomal-protein-alanine acetyltransferase [Paenibacillus sp. J31TS4]
MNEPTDRNETSPSLEFRAMRVDDIEAICAIEKEAFLTPWTPGAFYNELTNNHFAKYMVMERRGEVAGYGGMWLIMDEAHVTNIAVDHRYRGQGLGERLVTEMMRTARFLGAVRMTLEVRASNFVAQKLYRKLGFAEAGVRKGYYTDNQEDAYIMWAELVPAAGRA